MARPTIDNIWASTGSSVDPGTAKVNTGWTAEIPPFEYQNFWQNRVDQLLQNIEKNGIMEWDAATTYRVGSWVLATDNEIYRSITGANIGNDPIGSPANWEAFSDIVAVPVATETVSGTAEIATLAETQAGTDDTRIVTPKKVHDAIQQIVPDATTTLKGKVELATNTETQTGTDTVRAVTPAGLASVTATETRAGLVERATDAEVTTATDTTRYISPKQLTDRINALVPSASTTAQGKVELATNTEAQTGTDTTRAITPSALASVLASYFNLSVSQTFTGDTFTLDGFATLRLDNTTDANLASTGHAFQIGPTSGINLIEDNNSIQARNNGGASTLQLNPAGGFVTVNGVDIRNASSLNSGTLNDARLSSNVAKTNAEEVFSNSLGIGNATPGGTFDNGKALAIGDSDTGLRQNGDGVLELYANNQNIADVTTGGLNVVTGALSVSGVSVRNATSLFNTGTVPTARLPSASTGGKGIVELATDTESNAGTDTTRALVPSNFNQKDQVGTDGYQKFPGGLIIQWGITGTVGADQVKAITFPVAFPSACRGLVWMSNTTADQFAGGGENSIRNVTTTGANLWHGLDATVNVGLNWIAVGY